MNWREHIHSDPEILAGKPVVRGTRLGAGFVLELFASGWTHGQVLDSYPQLTPEALRAVIAFAAEAAANPVLIPETRAPRRPGSAQGQINMADDFDATPDDFNDD
jgi:uncharacterized protein (DUF433 family)